MLIFDYIESKCSNNYAMIMLHGHGGNKDSLKPLLNIISFKKNVSFYFLQAPYAISENSYSWSYEIKPGVWERDKPKLLLDDFFNNVISQKFQHSKIFILGFSQGAFICFEYALNINKMLGGIFPISGFTSESPSIHSSQINTPLIIGHGIDDRTIDVSSSENAYNYYTKIKKMNNVELITYKGGHKIGLKYLKAVNLFMNQNNIK